MTDTYTPHVASDPTAYTPQVSSEPKPDAYTPQVSPDPDLDRIRRGLDGVQTSQGGAMRELFEAEHYLPWLTDYVFTRDRQSFARGQRRMFGDMAEPELSPEEANAEYGVEGRLRFDAPVDRNIAEWRQQEARAAEYEDQIVGNADLSWWQSMGATFAGSVTDPVSLALWLVPELGAANVLKSGWTASRVARLGSVGRHALSGSVEGVAGGVLYEGANLWRHHESGDDYSLGQASANILLGGLFGGVAGGAGGWWEGRGGRSARAPALVQQLDDDARMGAFVQGLDAMINDRPVDLGPVLMRENARRAAGGPILSPEIARMLDETPGGGGAERDLSLRFVRDAEAVTPGGQSFGVGYVLVEADDLVARLDDDLYPDPRFPRELAMGRMDGARSVAEREIGPLEKELNPKQMLFDTGTEGGAPVVSRRGLVENGSRRVAALRRAYAADAPAVKRYKAELEAQGLDIKGMKSPMLVRLRRSTLTGDDRLRLIEDMNGTPTRAEPTPQAAEPPANQSASRTLLDRFTAWQKGDARQPLFPFGPDPTDVPKRAAERPTPQAKPRIAKGQTPGPPRGDPLADPEAAALAADIEDVAARAGVELKDDRTTDVQMIADAVAVAATCLAKAA